MSEQAQEFVKSSRNNIQEESGPQTTEQIQTSIN